MIYKDETFEKIVVDLQSKEELKIENCTIQKIVISGCIFENPVSIKNSIIHEFNAVGSWFKKGLHISECTFRDKVTFEAGGHNEEGRIEIQNNVFMCFVDFFDAYFNGPFHFNGNILHEGSNLLFEPLAEISPRFCSEVEIINNKGDLDLK